MKSNNGTFTKSIDTTLRINANRKKRVAISHKKEQSAAELLTLPRETIVNHLTAYINKDGAKTQPLSKDLILEVSF